MAMKRECDRCHHLTMADSLKASEMRVVRVERGGTASSHGGSTMLTNDYDLCKNCLIALKYWVENHTQVDPA